MRILLPELVSRDLTFCRRVLRIQSEIVVADFRTVIDDFYAVISALNARYGTSFAVLDNRNEIREKEFAETVQKGLIRHEGHFANKARMPDDRRDDENRLIIGRLQEVPQFELCTRIYRKIEMI